MKKIFVLVLSLTLLLAGTTVFAQGVKGDKGKKAAKEQKTPEEKAASVTKHMAKDLNLTADQTGNLEAVNLKHAQATEALRTKFADDRKGMMPEMKALNATYENELKAVLTAAQLTKYQNEKEEKMKARQEKMAANKSAL